MSILQRFFALNRVFCDKIASHLPQTKPNFWERYAKSVAHYMNNIPNQMVVDIGSGKHCFFAQYRNSAMQTHIIGVDISEEQLKENRDVDETRIADAARELPFADGEVDMIVSQSAMEHLRDVDQFVKESARVLRSGGAFIHLFPSKNAPFALFKRMVPNEVSRRCLHFFWPESRDWGGFAAYYDNCSYRAVQKLLAKHGFEILSIETSYYQSNYYAFFAPFYLLSALYEMLIYRLGLRFLSAHILVVAAKKRQQKNVSTLYLQKGNQP
jgi:ubiquinone/menaquinone biosynthesis C-methylase UbiE